MQKVVPQISIGELEGLKVIITHVEKMAENQLGFKASFLRGDTSIYIYIYMSKNIGCNILIFG
jgi:hypothetical protein